MKCHFREHISIPSIEPIRSSYLGNTAPLSALETSSA